MWGHTCIPRKGYPVLYPCKRPFRCAKAPPVLVCCWLVVALIRAPGQGTRKGLKPSLPATLQYETTVRVVRSAPWDAQAVLTQTAMATRRTRPPPAEGVLSRLGDRPVRAPRGRQQPLGDTTRQRASAPDPCGCGMVLLVASGDRCRLPVALGRSDPRLRGHQHLRCRELLQACVPPAWTRQLVVVADAGCAAHATRRCSTEHHDGAVCAMPRPRQLTKGPHRGDVVPHRPNSCDPRRASDTPDGRRQDDWVLARRAIIWVLSRSSGQSHGVTMGRTA